MAVPRLVRWRSPRFWLVVDAAGPVSADGIFAQMAPTSINVPAASVADALFLGFVSILTECGWPTESRLDNHSLFICRNNTSDRRREEKTKK